MLALAGLLAACGGEDEEAARERGGGDPGGSTGSRPVASDDTATLSAGSGAVRLDVLGNDTFGSDGPGDVGLAVTSGPANGTATVDVAGTTGDPTDDVIVYAPASGFTGTDTFAYQLRDADGDAATATVRVTVTEPNGHPSAAGDTTTVAAGSADNAIDVLANDDFGRDGPGDPALVLDRQPDNGAARIDDAGTAGDFTDDVVRYTPDGGYSGADTIGYTIADADGDTATAEVSIEVTAPTSNDDQPVASGDRITLDEDAGTTAIDVLANDDFGDDGPGSPALRIEAAPAHGVASVDDGGTPGDPADDTIAYTPDADYNGGDELAYGIRDADGDAATAFVTIEVRAVNDLPVARDDSASVIENSGTTAIDVLANDDFGGDGPAPMALALSASPQHGTASVDTAGTPDDPRDDTVTYAPNTDYTGSDALGYRFEDANGDVATASVGISVTAGTTGEVTQGLEFPGSDAVAGTMRFRFRNPLDIYPATYIWRAYPRQQSGYYTAFFWGNDDGQDNLNTFLWTSNGGADSYYGAHPYPKNPPDGSTHEWEISVVQQDFTNGDVEYGRWHVQALRVWADASGKHHEFYWDLPNTDADHRVTYTADPSWGETAPPAPALTWGDAPWAPGNEVWDGILTGFQVYSSDLTVQEILEEVENPLSTQAGRDSIWYLNLNPAPNDIADDSGKGNDPEWVGDERPTLWEK